jgi:hypothetical protein
LTLAMGRQLISNLLANDVTVFKKVFVVGAHGQILLGNAWVGDDDVDQMVPKGPTGAADHSLPPADNQQGTDDDPVRHFESRFNPRGT